MAVGTRPRRTLQSRAHRGKWIWIHPAASELAESSSVVVVLLTTSGGLFRRRRRQRLVLKAGCGAEKC